MPSMLCYVCAERAFFGYQGWSEESGPRTPPPAVPRLVDGTCPTCGGHVGLDPRHVFWHNVHGPFSTGLPEYFELVIKVPGSEESRGSRKWGLPYR